MTDIVGDVALSVLPDTSRFDPELKARLRQLSTSFAVKIGADTAQFDRDLDKLKSRNLSLPVSLKAKLDSSALAGVKNQLKSATKDLVVKIFPKLDAASLANVRKLLDDLVRDRTVNIRATVDTRVAADEIALLVRSRTVNVTANANTQAATARLNLLTRSRSVSVNANLGGSGLSGASSGLSGFMGLLTSLPALVTAALPTLASLAQSIVAMAPAAALAVPAIAAVGSAVAAIKLGTSGIGAAFKAAFSDSTAGATAAASNTAAVAAAQQALRAAQQGVASAERDLTTAQANAKQAQLDLNAARKQAVQDLQDMNNQLVDSSLSQRDATLRVQQAQIDLNKTLADPTATQLQRQQAQLTYDEAVQNLKEQGLAHDRLAAKTAAANKAGVAGDANVVASQKKVADANQTVADKQEAVREALQKVAAATTAVAAANVKTTGTVDQFAAAMAKLAPNARAFVNAIRGIKPSFDSMKLSVQNSLFDGLGSRVANLAQRAIPTLKTGLTGTAGALNTMAKNALSAFSSLEKTGKLSTILGGGNKALGSLTKIPGQIVTAFGQIAVAAEPAFQKVSAGVGGLATDISNKLSKAFKSGALTNAINGALVIAKQFGKLIGDVLKTVGNVLEAAAAGGGNALGALGAVFQQLAKITAMPSIKAALTSIFTLVNKVVGALAGPLGVALQAVILALAPIAQALTPIIELIGKGLMQAVKALTPVLMPIGKLIAAAIGILVPILKPIISIIVQVVQALSGPLSTVISGLTPIINTFGILFSQVFAALQPIIKPLIGIITSLANLMATYLTTEMKALTPIILALMPAIVALVSIFAQLVSAVLTPLIPILNQLAPMFGTVLMTIFSAITPILGMLVGVLMQLLPTITPLIPVIGNLVAAVAGLIPPLLQLALAVLIPLMPLIVELASLITTLLAAALLKIVPILVAVLTALTNLITRGLKALAPAISSVAKFLKAILGPAFSWLVGIVRSVKASTLDEWSKLWKGFTSIAKGAWSLVKVGFDLFSGNFKQAVRDLKSGLGSIWTGLESVFKAPVKFIVNTVYGAGIKKLWDTIAGKVGLPSLPSVKLPKGFATGGVIPGTSSFQDGDSMMVPMRPGEGVYVSEAMKNPYERARLHAVNQAAMSGKPLAKFQGGYSIGGIIGSGWGDIKGGLGKVADAGKWGLGKLKDITRGGLALVAKPVINAIKKTVDKTLPLSPEWSHIMNSFAKKPLDGVMSFFKNDDKKANDAGTASVKGYKPSAGVAQWAGVTKQALGLVNQPASLVNTVLRRMNQESGGNPNIVNKWDSNWTAGHPSVGLMQVIKGTFQEYAGKYKNTGPFSYGVSVNPLANIYSSMRYAMSRYGSLASAYNRPGGYKNGGTPSKGEVAMVGEAGPELVQFGSTARVYTNKDTQGILANSTGQAPVIINQTLPEKASAETFADEMAYSLRLAKRRGSI